MARLTSKQLKQLLDFLRVGYACHDQEAFVTHLICEISKLIPSEVTSYSEIDLRTGPVEDRTKVTPADVRFPGDRQIFEEHLSEHPILTYYQQTCNGEARTLSDFLTRSQFHRLELYQKFYRQEGVEDQMAIMLPVQSTRPIGIGLHRGRRNFSERDRMLLNLLRPHLAQAYANAQAVSAMQQDVRLSRQALETNGQGVVVLTKDGQVRLMTGCARDRLATYFGLPARDTERLPEALRAWITHQEAVLGRADDVPPPREPLRVQRDGTCLLVRHLCEADHCLLLLEERQAVNQPFSFAKDGLTRREAEVLQWVTQGKTNAEIGCILGMSTRTAQKHVEHIFEKLGVETRTAAATLALSRRSGG
jgi:DNA-binding CsgD family transcriptional regulator